MEIIPDYETGKYCFSDGVGIISKKFAQEIQEEFEIPYLPSAFQIRCLGFKGVLSIDDRHPNLIDAGGDKLILFRESQKKFDVPSNIEIVLGIVKYSSPGLVRFNKPLINLWDQVFKILYMLLQTLFFQAATKQGLSQTFNHRVNELFSQNLYQITLPLLDSASFNDALKKLPNYIPFPRCVRKIWLDEPFFRSMVIAAAIQKLRKFKLNYINFDNFRILGALQYYKQINLPSDLGRSMLGIVDVTGLLKPGQVFVQYTKEIGSYTGMEQKIVCKGKEENSGFSKFTINFFR